jgi:hypothetical protein
MTSTCQVSLPPSAVFEPPSLIVVIIIYLPSRIWQLLKAKTTLEMPTDWTLNIPLYLGIAQVAPLHVWVPLPQCGLISKVRTYFSVSNSFIEEVMHTLLHAVDLPWLCKFVCHLDTAFKSQQTDDLSNCEPASSWLVCWCRAAQSTNENWRGALDAPRRMSVSFLSKKKHKTMATEEIMWLVSIGHGLMQKLMPCAEVRSPIYPKSIQNIPKSSKCLWRDPPQSPTWIYHGISMYITLLTAQSVWSHRYTLTIPTTPGPLCPAKKSRKLMRIY